MSILFYNFVLRKGEIKHSAKRKLTPKSRNGKQDMNMQNVYRKEIEELLRKSSNHTLYKIIAAIDEKRYQITRLLENGRPIFETASGKHFTMLYDQRMKLWLKVKTLDQCASIVLNNLQ